MRAIPFTAAMVAAFCVAGMALAQSVPPAPPELAGRWVAQKRSLVLDISRCGAGWCGVEVKDGRTCGAIALRVELPRRSPAAEHALIGRLELAAGAEPYAVEVRFFEASDDGQFKLIISGNSGDKFEPWSRRYSPFRELMARSGDAVCPPVPKVS
jgi:hypothetical protein